MTARELGLRVGSLEPGPDDAITDVPGVRVGMTTLVEGEGPLRVGHGPVRTGVTVILPHEGDVGDDPVFAGGHRLNGNGEMTGLEWIRESGLLTSPIGITNTHSVGVVRDALALWPLQRWPERRPLWGLPVVAETYDGDMNDINGRHVRPEHVEAALEGASGRPPAQGNVGGGTGMLCHGFKGGTGTASRRLPAEAGGHVLGVLVQANHGARARLRVNGVPVGERIGPDVVPLADRPGRADGGGSIIVVVATDAPLLPGQCARLAQRASLGVARTGGAGEHGSGDLLIAFATGNRGLGEAEHGDALSVPVRMYGAAHVDALFYAAIEATEAAIVNALVAAETMTGRDGFTAHAIGAERLLAALEPR